MPMSANGRALAFAPAPLPLSLAPLAPKTADGAGATAKAHWRIWAFRSWLKSPDFCPQAPPNLQALASPLALPPILAFAHPLPFMPPLGLPASLFIWCFPFGASAFVRLWLSRLPTLPPFALSAPLAVCQRALLFESGSGQCPWFVGFLNAPFNCLGGVWVSLALGLSVLRSLWLSAVRGLWAVLALGLSVLRSLWL